MWQIVTVAVGILLGFPFLGKYIKRRYLSETAENKETLGSRTLEISIPRELNEDEVEVYVESRIKELAKNGNRNAYDVISGNALLSFCEIN